MENRVKINEVNPSFTNRRSFLKISGLTLVGTSLLMAGCNNDDDDVFLWLVLLDCVDLVVALVVVCIDIPGPWLLELSKLTTWDCD